MRFLLLLVTLPGAILTFPHVPFDPFVLVYTGFVVLSVMLLIGKRAEPVGPSAPQSTSAPLWEAGGYPR